MSINGKEYKFAIPAWLCVHPAHQRQGLAKKMAQKLLEIAKREGNEGGYTLHEPKQHGVDNVLLPYIQLHLQGFYQKIRHL